MRAEERLVTRFDRGSTSNTADSPAKIQTRTMTDIDHFQGPTVSRKAAGTLPLKLCLPLLWRLGEHDGGKGVSPGEAPEHFLVSSFGSSALH